MKAEIHDRETVEGLNSLDVVSYLRSAGWTEETQTC